MGWAKYDEDNRDYIEERWSVTGYMRRCSTIRRTIGLQRRRITFPPIPERRIPI